MYVTILTLIIVAATVNIVYQLSAYLSSKNAEWASSLIVENKAKPYDDSNYVWNRASTSTQRAVDEATLVQMSVTDELSTRFAISNPALEINKQEKMSLWWDGYDGYNFIIPATESVIFAAIPGRYIMGANIPETFFKDELKIADEVFARRGFSRDAYNSSTSTLDTSRYDYVQAYKKADTVCAITVSSEYSSYTGTGIGRNAKMGYALFAECGDLLANDLAEQRAISDALEPNYKGFGVHVDRRDGDFMSVGLRGRRGGVMAILKQTGKTYRVLIVTQEAPPCALMDKEKIPLSLLGSIGGGACYGDNGRYREAPMRSNI